jgi:hypothetical protein
MRISESADTSDPHVSGIGSHNSFSARRPVVLGDCNALLEVDLAPCGLFFELFAYRSRDLHYTCQLRYS